MLFQAPRWRLFIHRPAGSPCFNQRCSPVEKTTTPRGGLGLLPTPSSTAPLGRKKQEVSQVGLKHHHPERQARRNYTTKKDEDNKWRSTFQKAQRSRAAWAASSFLSFPKPAVVLFFRLRASPSARELDLCRGRTVPLLSIHPPRSSFSHPAAQKICPSHPRRVNVL